MISPAPAARALWENSTMRAALPAKSPTVGLVWPRAIFSLLVYAGGAKQSAKSGQGRQRRGQITAFGAGEESWLIAHEVFWGNPGVEVDLETEINVWEQLDAFLLRQWQHECGPLLSPSIVLIGSAFGCRLKMSQGLFRFRNKR